MTAFLRFRHVDPGGVQIAAQPLEIAVENRAVHAGDDGTVDIRGMVVDEPALGGIKGEGLVQQLENLVLGFQ